MKIGTRQIGAAHPAYIIAELGVNHDGRVERALELTQAAAAAGADAVKLQFFETDRLMSKAAKLAAYQRTAGETDPIAMLRRLELGIDDMARIVNLAHRLGVHAIVTVFSVELVPVAQQLAWDAYKTASPDIVHRPLLDALAATGKPLIVSTGASTIDEVRQAAEWLVPAHDRLAFMQCVSCYPTPEDAAELDGIAAIAAATGLPIGYSDHTSSIETGRLAVARGACILEKHFTYSRAAKGPDHAASLEADGLARYVQLVRTAKAAPQLSARADAKRILDIERDVRAVSRQSLVTTSPLSAGTRLDRDHITFKRPGTGLLPFELDQAVGRVLTRDVDADVPLTAADLGLTA